MPRHVQHRPEEVLVQRLERRRRAARRRAPSARPSAPSAVGRRARPTGASPPRCRRRADGRGRPPASATRGRGARARASCRNGDADRHRVRRRADVVQQAGAGQLGRARAAADRVLRLQHRHLDALARERDRARQAVRPGADDYRAAHATGAGSGRLSPLRVTSTGKSKLSSSQGPRSIMSRTLIQPSSTRPGRGVVDAVVLLLDVRGLRLEHHDAQLARART